jgi:hypothetical protein
LLSIAAIPELYVLSLSVLSELVLLFLDHKRVQNLSATKT